MSIIPIGIIYTVTTEAVTIIIIIMIVGFNPRCRKSDRYAEMRRALPTTKAMQMLGRDAFVRRTVALGAMHIQCKTNSSVMGRTGAFGGAQRDYSAVYSAAEAVATAQPLVGPAMASFLSVSPAIAAQILFLSPMQAIRQFRADGTTGPVSVMPYAAMAANGAALCTCRSGCLEPTMRPSQLYSRLPFSGDGRWGPRCRLDHYDPKL